jgi:RNase P subunit RPR2
MTCKKCGGEMRLWLLRPEFKSFVCSSCEFVAIPREDSSKRNGEPQRDEAVSLRFMTRTPY